MKIRFNIPCTVEQRDGNDEYGQEKVGAPLREFCQVVKLEPRIQHSTVRSDASGSRGAADETRADAVILLSPATRARIQDYMTVAGVRLRVIAIRHRYSVGGALNHYEASCESL